MTIRTRNDIFEPRVNLTIPLTVLHLIFYFIVQTNSDRAAKVFVFEPASALSAPWTFVTYQFLHYGTFDLFFGTLFFYVLASALESSWGTGEFAAFWAIATFAASGIAFFLGQPLFSGWMIVNVSMLFAYATMFPETVFTLFFILPVKVTWMAYASVAYLVYRFVVEGPARGFIYIVGASAGYLFYWVRHHGTFRMKKAARDAVAAAKTAGAVREDRALETRNRALFPKVEALRAATRAGELPDDLRTFAGELPGLVVAGVKICKPVDFKGDKDGICVRCEGFAECSLRYVAGQPDEIVVKKRDQ
ncbi:MAG TPA: rhomboid family intramembrane serine protease [Thermoanaerobaculia bacterium]|nr:rhomboid family intramembrane serine protease [Thermoanaerobaculia bacterium]